MNANEYRELYGFSINAPLCTQEYSALRSQMAIDGNYIDRLNRKGRKRGEPKDTKTAIGKPKKWSVSVQNARNICDEQVKKRLQYVADVCPNPSSADVRRIDPPLMGLLNSRFGSINKAKKTTGLKINKKTTLIPTGQLVFALREYVKKHGKNPWKKDRPQNGFPFYKNAYYRAFGSMNRAYVECGIASLGRGKHNKIGLA